MTSFYRADDKTPIRKDKNGGSVVIESESKSGQNYLAYVSRYRIIEITTEDGQVVNDNTDTETVTVSVVDGLEVARGTDPDDAAVLDYSGDVTVSIDGVETTKTLSNGSVSFDLTNDKPAGSTITVRAESLADHPAESDSVEIEVVKA